MKTVETTTDKLTDFALGNIRLTAASTGRIIAPAIQGIEVATITGFQHDIAAAAVILLHLAHEVSRVKDDGLREVNLPPNTCAACSQDLKGFLASSSGLSPISVQPIHGTMSQLDHRFGIGIVFRHSIDTVQQLPCARFPPANRSLCSLIAITISR
jgi:hypothetical protein